MRHAVALREELAPLLRALERGLERGETSPHDRADVHVINLNHQSATSRGRSFLDHALDHFLNHQSAWNVCKSCKASDDCPIYANRNELACSPALERKNRPHREALVSLFRVAEQGGYVLTFRETLVLVAYLVTGGLSCADVEKKHRSRRPEAALYPYGLLPLLFSPDLTTDQEKLMRVLARFQRLDPGRVALRSVDERLHRELEATDVSLGG